MSRTKSRPEVIDEHGTRHRATCTLPGEGMEPSSAAGWAWRRCLGCGAVALTRASREIRKDADQ